VTFTSLTDEDIIEYYSALAKRVAKLEWPGTPALRKDPADSAGQSGLVVLDVRKRIADLEHQVATEIMRSSELLRRAEEAEWHLDTAESCAKEMEADRVRVLLRAEAAEAANRTTEARCIGCGWTERVPRAGSSAVLDAHVKTCPTSYYTRAIAAEARVRELEARAPAMPTDAEIDEALVVACEQATTLDGAKDAARTAREAAYAYTHAYASAYASAYAAAAADAAASAAAAAYAAAYAYAAASADAAAGAAAVRAVTLPLSASIAVEILTEMGSPGSAFLTPKERA